MKYDVNEIKNGCATKSWVDAYGSNVASNSLIIQITGRPKNVENVDVEEVKNQG